LQELIKHNSKPPTENPSSVSSPVTHSDIYLRVQPFTTSFTLPEQPNLAEDSTGTQPSTQTCLRFILLLSDPGHRLVHSTITQSVPGKWLDLWDRYDWVEDLVAEALRLGVEVVGQEYIVARMGWGNVGPSIAKPTEGDLDTVDEKAAPLE
jgi:hypothetical protein